MNFHDMTPEQIGAALFQLGFPRKDYFALPQSVRDSYIMDGARLKRIIENATDGAPSDNQSGRGPRDATSNRS